MCARADRDTARTERPCNVVEKPRAIARTHLDHRVAATGSVIDEDMRLKGDRGGARRPRRGIEGRVICASGNCAVLGKSADHALLESLQPLFVANRAAICGLKPDRVDGHSVAGREDSGIDDVRTRRRHRAGNGCEQADVIGRVQRHLRRFPGPIDAGLDQGPPAPALHEAGVALLHPAVGGQPVGI